MNSTARRVASRPIIVRLLEHKRNVGLDQQRYDDLRRIWKSGTMHVGVLGLKNFSPPRAGLSLR